MHYFFRSYIIQNVYLFFWWGEWIQLYQRNSFVRSPLEDLSILSNWFRKEELWLCQWNVSWIFVFKKADIGLLMQESPLLIFTQCWGHLCSSLLLTPTYYSQVILKELQVIIAFCLPVSQVLILLPIIPSLCLLDILSLI